MDGVLKIIPIEAFFDEHFGESQADRFERVMAIIDDRYFPPDDTIGWMGLRRAIRRNAMFSIEVQSPTLRIELGFSPNADGGTYKILPQPRGRPEEGRIESVLVWSPDMVLVNRQLARIEKYQNRFLVRSSTQSRPVMRKMWIIGIDDPVDADEK
jgi:hypothetical protein